MNHLNKIFIERVSKEGDDSSPIPEKITKALIPNLKKTSRIPLALSPTKLENNSIVTRLRAGSGDSSDENENLYDYIKNIYPKRTLQNYLFITQFGRNQSL